jgi:predicted transglutaminase-like cysteine proteinase
LFTRLAVATFISICAAALPTNTLGMSNQDELPGRQQVVASATAPQFQVAALPPIQSTPATKPGASLGVFNSVAISAARIPAARKWQEVLRTDYSDYFADDCDRRGFAGCDSRFTTRIRALRNSAGDAVNRDLLNQVNRTVNAAMTYKADRSVWGVGDYWATPAEMARTGAGDCEDYAIAKYWLLRSLGVADEHLQMVLLQDTRRQLFHAVLVVHTASGAYVLDNVTNRLQLDTAYGQYQPIMSFSGGKSYIHGFAAGRTVTAMPSDLSAVAPGLGM